jgi:hypothetical protein
VQLDSRQRSQRWAKILRNVRMFLEITENYRPKNYLPEHHVMKMEIKLSNAKISQWLARTNDFFELGEWTGTTELRFLLSNC